jgi:hypothetical protein
MSATPRARVLGSCLRHQVVDADHASGIAEHHVPGGRGFGHDRVRSNTHVKVERWFGYLTDQMIRRRVHLSLQALEADIRVWTWDIDVKWENYNG